MMKSEFEKIAGYEVSYQDYVQIIEPMYNATLLSKEEFAQTLDRKRFEVIRTKSDEELRLEAKIKEEIASYKNEIEFYKKEIELKQGLISVEDDSEWMKVWKSDIKRYKEEIKIYKNRINTLRWVLG